MLCTRVPESKNPDHTSPDRGNYVVFLGRHLTLTVLLSYQNYRWVPVNCWKNRQNAVMD